MFHGHLTGRNADFSRSKRSLLERRGLNLEPWRMLALGRGSLSIQMQTTTCPLTR
jgi:hypothetical protein